MDEDKINENDSDQEILSSDGEEPELIVIDESVYSSAEELEVEVKCETVLEYKSNQDQNMSSGETKDFQPELIVIDDDDEEEDEGEEQSLKDEVKVEKDSDDEMCKNEIVKSKKDELDLVVLDDGEESSTTCDLAGSPESRMLVKKSSDSNTASTHEGFQCKVKVEKDSDDEMCKNEIEKSNKNKDEFDLIVIDDGEESSTTCDATLDESFKDSDVKNDTDNETTFLTKCQALSSNEDKTGSCSKNRAGPSTEDGAYSSIEDKACSFTGDRADSSTEGRYGSSSKGRAGFSTDDRAMSSTKGKIRFTTEDKVESSAEDNTRSCAESKAGSMIENKLASLIEDKAGSSSIENRAGSCTKDSAGFTIENKSSSLTEDKARSSTENSSLSCCTEDKAGFIIKNKLASPTENESISPTEDESTSPTEDKLTSPTEDKLTSSTEDKSTISTEDKSTSPTEDKSTCSTKDESTRSTRDESARSTKDESMPSTKDEFTLSTKDESTSSTKDESTLSTKDESIPSTKVGSTPTTEDESTLSTKDESTLSPKDESTLSPKDESTSSHKDESTSSPKDESTSSTKDESTSSTKDESTSSTKDELTSSTKDESTFPTKDGSAFPSKAESTYPTKDKSAVPIADESTFTKGKSMFIFESKALISDKVDTAVNKGAFHKKNAALLEENTMSAIKSDNVSPIGNKILSGTKNITVSHTEDQAVSLAMDYMLSAIDKLFSSQNNRVPSNRTSRKSLSVNETLFRSASKILPLNKSEDVISFSSDKAVHSNKDLRMPFGKGRPSLKGIEEDKNSSIISKKSIKRKRVIDDENDSKDGADRFSSDSGNVMIGQEDLSNMLECQLEVGTPNVEWAEKVQNWQKLQQPIPFFNTESRPEVIHIIPEGKTKLTKKEFFNIKVFLSEAKRSFSFHHDNGPKLMKNLKSENFLNNPVEWLIQKGLASGNTECPKCHYKGLRKVKTTVYSDGYAWQCLNLQCKHYHAFVRPPFFNQYDYPLASLLAVVYHWCFQSHSNHLMEDTGLTIDSLVSLYQRLQLLCSLFTEYYDRNSRRAPKSYEVVEASVFQFGSILILAVYERATKLIRLQALPCDQDKLFVALSKFAEIFIDRNHIVVSDCSLIERLKIPCMGFSYADLNITNEDHDGLHCLNVISFVRRHVQGIFATFDADSVNFDVWQGYLNEVEWRQRYGMIDEVAFWSIMCYIAKKPMRLRLDEAGNVIDNIGKSSQNQAQSKTSISCIEKNNTDQGLVKQAIADNITHLNKSENDLCKDSFANKHSTSATVQEVPTNSGYTSLKDITSSEQSTLKNNFVESYNRAFAESSESDVISSVMFQPDGLDSVTVTALLSIRTWPLVGYLQNLIKASKQPVDYNVLDWRSKLEKEGFFSHPLKWLVDNKFAPENYSCNECKGTAVQYGDSEQHFLTCENILCCNVQPLKRPNFFSKFGFPMKDLLCLLYHWAAQLPFQTICESVSLNAYKVRYVFWGVQKHCSAILQKSAKLGNKNHNIEVGIIQYGEFCILGALNRQTKETRLKAMYAPILYKSSLFEPILNEWLCKGSTIFTCHNPFSLSGYKVIHVGLDNEDINLTTKIVTLYLKSIVSALFSQYSTIGIKVDIIQSFLDEIQWRQKYGCLPDAAFMSLLNQFTSDDELGYEQLIPKLTSSAPSTDALTHLLNKKTSSINDRSLTSEGQIKYLENLNVPFNKEKLQTSNLQDDCMDVTKASSSLSFSGNQIVSTETSPTLQSTQCSTVPENGQKTTIKRRETSRKRLYSGYKTYSKSQKRPSTDCKLDGIDNLDEIKKNKISKLNNKNETLVISPLNAEQNASGGVLISKYSRVDFLKKAKSVEIPFKDYFNKLTTESPEVRSNCLLSLGKIGGKLLRPVLTDTLSFLENPRVAKSPAKDNDKQLVPLDEYYFAEMKPNIVPSSESVSYVYSCTYCKIYLFGNIEVIDHTLKHIADRREKNTPKIFSCPFFMQRYITSAYCLFAFSSEGEQIHHLDDVHLETSSLSCLICSLPFCSPAELCKHMTDLHVPCEMPYTCPACPYRSSAHKEVLEHFQLIHKNDPHLVCPYCLKMCSPTRTEDPVLFTNAYCKHLIKHQEVNENVQCPSCCLLFFTYDDLYAHAVKDHVSFYNSADAVSFKTRCRPAVVLAKIVHPVPAPTSHPAAVFANSKISELAQLKNNQLLQMKKKMEEKNLVEKKNQQPLVQIKETELPCANVTPIDEHDEPPLEPIPTLQTEPMQNTENDQEWCLTYNINRKLPCSECGDQMDDKHFFKRLNCRCNYSTFCAKAFVLHTMQIHFTKEEMVRTLSLIPAKLSEKTSCSCLFSSDDPDVLASHLKTCNGVISIRNTDFMKTCQKKQQRLSEMFEQLGAVSPKTDQKQSVHMEVNDTLNLSAIDNSSRNPSSPPLENLPMSFGNRSMYPNEPMGNMPPPNSFAIPDFQNIPQYLSNISTTTTYTSINSSTHSYSSERLNELMRLNPNMVPYLVPQMPGNSSIVRETLSVPIPSSNSSIRLPPSAYGHHAPPYSIVPPKSNSRIKAGVMSVRNGVTYIQEVPIAMAGRYPPRVPFRGQSPTTNLSHGFRASTLRCLLRDNWVVPKDITTNAVTTPRCSLQQQQTQKQISHHLGHQQTQEQQKQMQQDQDCQQVQQQQQIQQNQTHQQVQQQQQIQQNQTHQQVQQQQQMQQNQTHQQVQEQSSHIENLTTTIKQEKLD